MPGIIGGLTGTIAAALADTSIYGETLDSVYEARGVGSFGRSAGEQATYQFITLLITLGIALASGWFTAKIIQLDFFEPVSHIFNLISAALWPNESHELARCKLHVDFA
jgi:hypothetical protein